jgi:uncharacterized membrane protein
MGFSVSSALRFGWETFKKRPWFFVVVTLIVTLVEFVIEILAGVIAAVFASSDTERLIFFFIAYFSLGIVFGTFVAMGWTAFYLAAHDNPDTVELSALWPPRPFWKYLGTYLLVLVVVLAGILLLIVPGMILALMFMFAPVIVIDRELRPIAAMKESHRITRGHKWRLLGLVLVLAPISLLWLAFDQVLGAPAPFNLLGALVILAGLLVLWPVAALAVTRVYRVLSGTAGMRSEDATLAA